MTTRNCKGNPPANVKPGECYIVFNRATHPGAFPWEVRRANIGSFDFIDGYRSEQHARIAAACQNLGFAEGVN